MKIRYGFVANSSSSSFVIDKFYLSQFQVEAIHMHTEYADELGLFDDPWVIKETEYHIKGSTPMDNFNMYRFLEFIGVDMKYVHWDGAEAERIRT